MSDAPTSTSSDPADVQAEAHARTAEARAHTNRTNEGGVSFVALFGGLALTLALVATVFLIPGPDTDVYRGDPADTVRTATQKMQDSIDRSVDLSGIVAPQTTGDRASSPLGRLAAPASATPSGRDSLASRPR